MGLAATTNIPYIIHLIADKLMMRPEKGAFIDRLICALRNQTSMLLAHTGSEGKDDGSTRGKHVAEVFLTRARLTRSKVGG